MSDSQELKAKFKFVRKKEPLRPENKIEVVGWHCTLEVREKDEIFGLGFTSNNVDYPGRKKPVTVKRRFRTEERDHGFLIASLLNASKYWDDLRKWRIEYGVVEPLMEIRDYADSFSRNFKISTLHPNEVWYDFAQKSHGIRIEGLEESYKMSADSMLPLIAWEILELFRRGKTFQFCPCGKLYVTRPHQRANHCVDCKEPSRMPVRLLPEEKKKERREAGRRRAKKYNAKKREEVEVNKMSKKDREQLMFSMDRIIKGGR